MMAQQFTPFQQDVVKEKIEELSPIELALQQRGDATKSLCKRRWDHGS